jgi:flavodoxin
MKILIVYYSRTNTTKKVAEELQKKLNCDIEEIIDTKNRMGPMAYVIAGRDAIRKKLTEIKATQKDPADYDLVIVGTPVWLTVTPAVRTYLRQHRSKFKKIAFFCTMDGSGFERTFRDMKKECTLEPASTMVLISKTVKSNSYQEKFDNFIKQLQ